MQMSILKGWHGGLLEEAPKEELRRSTQRGIVGGFPLKCSFSSHLFQTENSLIKFTHSVIHSLTQRNTKYLFVSF